MNPFDMPAADIENTCCPLCRSADASIIHTWKPFAVVRCAACGLAYLNPRPREAVAHRLYKDGDYFSAENTAGYADYRSQEKGLRVTLRRFLVELRRRGMASGRVLEIGSGYGYFLAEASDFFSSVSGLELSAEAAAHARALGSWPVHVGDIHSLPADWHEFDALIMVNVIEHIHDPLSFLRIAGARLKDEGRMIIATPDFGSPWHAVLGKRWPSFKVPEHVAFYTAATLGRLLRETGFEDIERVPFSHAFPLFLVAEKLGLRLRGRLGERTVWIPGTMLALAGRLRR